MMTFGNFMKWDLWRCLVGRNPSRKNASSFGTEGKTKQTKPLADFQTYLLLLEKLVARGKTNTFSLLG